MGPQMRGGMFGGARLLMAVEEHGGGKQLMRFRLWPWCSPGGLLLTLLCTALSVTALASGADGAAAVLAALAAVLAVRTLYECAAATGALRLAAFAVVKVGAEQEAPARKARA